MVASNPYNKYQQNSVMSASPGDLTMMLYDGCLKFLKLSVHYFGEKDVVQAVMYAHKAQKIIRELQDTLNMKISVSSELYSLYSFIDRRISEGVKNSNTKCITDCIGLVNEMRTTWQLVLKENRKKSYGNMPMYGVGR